MEAPCIFTLMLKKFHKIIEGTPTASKVKTELDELQNRAENSGELNPRQKDAIIARCKNYMNGIYGNTKTEEHMGHAKPVKA